MPRVECLDCESMITVPRVAEVGNLVVCEQCGSEMEIVSMAPPELDWPYDYYDYDDDKDSGE